jgi:hypothetical protein
MNLTPKEKNAIAALKRLAATWPKSLWLFATGNALSIMKRGPNGKRMMEPTAGHAGGGVDPRYEAASVNIPNDGGDW